MARDEASEDAIERARGLGPLLREAAVSIEARRELTPEVVEALHDARMFRLLLPKSLGGDELDLKTHAAVIEVISSFDASTAWCMGQGAGCAMAAAFLDQEAAQRLFGPREAVLAWGAGIQGRAIAVEGGYRVTGKWAFASGSRHATLLGGHSYLYDTAGQPLMAADGRHLDRTMLFARDKATIDDNWFVMGLCGTGSDSYAVEDLFVPAADTVDRDNLAECREPGALFKCSTSLAYGVSFAAVQLGLARAMLDELRAIAMTKTPRGATSSLRESPVFQTELARLEASYRAQRAYLHSAADTAFRQAGTAAGLSIGDRSALKLATVHVINECVEVITGAYRAAGATAIFPRQPFERRLRDALTASQQVQGRVQNYLTAGRCLLDLEPDTTMFL